MIKHSFAFLIALSSIFCFKTSAQCPTGELEVKIVVQTDTYGYECYWELLPDGNNCGNGTLFSGGNSLVGCNGGGARLEQPGGYGNNIDIAEGPWCLTEGASYNIYFVDDWGDGGPKFNVYIGGFPVYQFVAKTTNETYIFKVQLPPNTDASMESFSTDPYVEMGNVDVEGHLKNVGQNTINSFDLHYSIDNGSINSATIDSVQIAPFTIFDFKHPNPFVPVISGNHSIKCWVSNVNGTMEDSISKNDTIRSTLFVINQKPNIIDSYVAANANYTLTTIANNSLGIQIPRDLDFHPNGDLWVINKGTESSGGETVTLINPGKSNQRELIRQDGNARHFMNVPSGIAFSKNGNFATSTSVYDANFSGGSPFTGPSLWSSDSIIYAKPSGGNGSHLDMLHESPRCMGIANEKKNVFWVFDGFHEDIVRYDFVADHGPGNSDHTDGIIRRFKGMTVKMIDDHVVSHLVLDKAQKWLYVVDGGNKRILRLDITSGAISGAPSFTPNEPLAEYSDVTGVTWEIVADSGLIKPSGIEIVDNNLLVSDYTNGHIIVYDLTAIPAKEKGRILTGSPGIMGIVAGPEGKIWYVNASTSLLKRIDPDSTITQVSRPEMRNNILFVFPNPITENATIYVDDENYVDYRFRLVDILGNVVFERQVEARRTTIDFNAYKPGIYFLLAENGKEIFKTKLFIAH